MDNIHPDNISIGTDIEGIERFEELEAGKDKDFLSKIFSENELKYCFSKKDPAQHLAARFAGKEAVIKALLSFGFEALPYDKIEILNNEKGAPYVKGPFENGFSAKISLSHSADFALAFAVVIKQ